MRPDEPSPDALSVLTVEPRTVPLAGGRRLVLEPVRVRQMPAFLAALGPARGQIAGMADAWDLIAEHGECLSEALALACSVPRADIDALLPAEYLAALEAMLEANADFFRSWLLGPMLRAARQTSPE